MEIVGGTTLRQSGIRFSGRMTVANRLAVCSVLGLLASCVLLTAQNVVLTGALGGRVTDPSGAVVPGVSVVARNLATGVEQTARTNHAGLYRFPTVMPGSYSITANLKGFREVEALVRVLVGNTTSQDIKLQVGASADAIASEAASRPCISDTVVETQCESRGLPRAARVYRRRMLGGWACDQEMRLGAAESPRHQCSICGMITVVICCHNDGLGCIHVDPHCQDGNSQLFPGWHEVTSCDPSGGRKGMLWC